MRKLFLVTSVSLVLAACGADAPVGQAEQGVRPSLESTTPPVARKPILRGALDSALEDFQERAPSAIRYDRIRTLDDGTKQRQLFVEMLGASAEETDVIAAEAFEEAGFSIHKGMVDENGIRLQYRQDGVEPLNILIRSAEAGPPLNEADATSSFYVRQTVD